MEYTSSNTPGTLERPPIPRCSQQLSSWILRPAWVQPESEGTNAPLAPPAKKPSESSTTTDNSIPLSVFCPGISLDHQHEQIDSEWLSDGTFQSKRLTRYSSSFSNAIASCFFLSFQRMQALGRGPSGPGIGCASATKTPTISCWPRLGSGQRCVVVLNESSQFGNVLLLALGSWLSTYTLRTDW